MIEGLAVCMCVKDACCSSKAPATRSTRHKKLRLSRQHRRFALRTLSNTLTCLKILFPTVTFASNMNSSTSAFAS